MKTLFVRHQPTCLSFVIDGTLDWCSCLCLPLICTLLSPRGGPLSPMFTSHHFTARTHKRISRGALSLSRGVVPAGYKLSLVAHRRGPVPVGAISLAMPSRMPQTACVRSFLYCTSSPRTHFRLTNLFVSLPGVCSISLKDGHRGDILTAWLG